MPFRTFREIQKVFPGLLFAIILMAAACSTLGPLEESSATGTSSGTASLEESTASDAPSSSPGTDASSIPASPTSEASDEPATSGAEDSPDGPNPSSQDSSPPPTTADPAPGVDNRSPLNSDASEQEFDSSESPDQPSPTLPNQIPVPDVAGLALDDAKTVLLEAGFELGNLRIVEVAHDEIPTGIVLRTEPPAGSVVPAFADITIVATGP